MPGYAGGAELIIGGTDDRHIAANGTSSLVSGTTEFQLIGISPEFDEAATGFASAFPVQLSFAGTDTSQTITPLQVSAPEPWSVAVFGIGLAGLGLTRRRSARG